MNLEELAWSRNMDQGADDQIYTPIGMAIATARPLEVTIRVLTWLVETGHADPSAPCVKFLAGSDPDTRARCTARLETENFPSCERCCSWGRA